MVVVNKTYYPTFEEYFRAHGEFENEPRVLLPFHKEICQAFEQVILGELPEGKTNLMILIPPRHGKTFLARDFVSYSDGIFPDSEFIYTGYSATIATAQTASIKMTMEKDWYQATFNVELDKAGEGYFTTKQGGAVFAVGVGGSITGFGAGKKRPEFGGAIVIDDPLKADDARSQAVKQHLREWYTGVLSSRKNYKTTPIILIQQRLAPDDLAGYILETEAEKWHVIQIKALQDNGKALWEDTKSAADLKRLKEIDEFTFFAQYQQQPQAEGGNIIKRDWWKYYRTEGTDDKGKPIDYILDGLIFLTADTAMKIKTRNDYSVFAAWHATGKYLDLLDVYRRKMEFPELMRQAKLFWEKWERWNAQTLYIEGKVSGISLGQSLSEQGIPVILWKPSDYEFPEDKIGRVNHSTFYIHAGRVRLPLEKPEMCRCFVEECAAFTGDDGVHDDQVDNLTEAVSVWKRHGGGSDVKAA